MPKSDTRPWLVRRDGQESRIRTWELRGSSSGIWPLVDQQGGRLEGVSRTCPVVARAERTRNVTGGGLAVKRAETGSA